VAKTSAEAVIVIMICGDAARDEDDEEEGAQDMGCLSLRPNDLQLDERLLRLLFLFPQINDPDDDEEWSTTTAMSGYDE
jgi:hypothetical protein